MGVIYIKQTDHNQEFHFPFPFNIYCPNLAKTQKGDEIYM